MRPEKKDIDELSGIETTGHSWDGIKELNTPSPRWWLIIFIVSCVWAVGYWFYYPAWPTLTGNGERGGTEGTAGWTQYKQLEEQQAEIVARKAAYQSRFDAADFSTIQNDEELYAFAIAGGKSAFKDNCATCHGTGGAGGPGYPNLNDDDWIWGGTIEDIQQTLQYGIRGNHDETRFNEMPAYADILDAEDIEAVADYVVAKAAGNALPERGAVVFEENCAACHGEDAKGLRELGGPNLADAIWLYADDRNAIVSQIRKPKHGIMPAWEGRLSPSTIRQLTIYVHSLGGGEK
ncbi:cytochrome-c oxidase, cbb3-type subunit III [Kordiimonas laminariae]|uniref:cytochrome-c oxidase, cbb3-type subunit III n=1 Tax=Kordiimonas laminariae TaxID=2917717 RepID=UPI001FF63E4D|nr:cytochrome-c oxidase, cbb3-type subunit III [Kordiimonas laminariae]MCK0068270.1 cytochrome-c oxidase, cbb3-type subunit III [Kordiimonas laminariae]